MVCKKCGKYNPDYSKVCMYCGESLEQGQTKKSFYDGVAWKQDNQPKVVKDRTLMGILFCLFLNIIGLLIGYCCISDPQERETFTKSWLETFVVIFILVVCSRLIFDFILGASSCSYYR